jgi:hypothetical protein
MTDPARQITTDGTLLLGWGWAAFGWLSSAFNAHLVGRGWVVDLVCAAWSLVAVALIAVRRPDGGRG